MRALGGSYISAVYVRYISEAKEPTPNGRRRRRTTHLLHLGTAHCALRHSETTRHSADSTEDPEPVSDLEVT